MKLTPRFYSITALIVIAAMTRLFPHPPNFTAIGAMALFGGAMISDKRLAYLIPIAAMYLSDLFLPGGGVQELAVLLCMIIATTLGILISKKPSILNVAGASLGSSVIFYLITNLPFWYGSLGLYTNDLNGVIQSYTAALPFFQYTILGDLSYSAAIFGVFLFAEKRFPVLAR